MSKLKLKLKKRVDEKLSLTEHVNVDNAVYIGTGNGYDVFRIATFQAMQQFKVGTSDTPCNFTHNESDFNSHLGEGHNLHLYLFVDEDTYRCWGAVLDNQSETNIKYNGSRSYVTLNIIFEDIEGNANNIPNGKLLPLYLVPGVEGTFTRNPSDSDEVLDCLHQISGIEIPTLPEPETPADEVTPEDDDEPEDFELADEDEVVEPEDEEEEELPETQPEENGPTEEPQTPQVERGKYGYKIVGKEVYLTHVRLDRNDRSNRTITLPNEIEGKPVTTL